MRTARIIIYFLIGVLLAQCVYYYPNLPAVMASNFDGFGRPNGWMTKTGFFIFEAVLLLLVVAEFTLLPFLIRKSPDRLLNLPNKAHWLTKDRRERTFAAIATYFEWFSVLLLLLFIAVNQLVFRANITGQNLSSKAIWLILGAFFAFMIFWLVKFIRRFKIKKYES